jgi:hypothetical protein
MRWRGKKKDFVKPSNGKRKGEEDHLTFSLLLKAIDTKFEDSSFLASLIVREIQCLEAGQQQ